MTRFVKNSCPECGGSLRSWKCLCKPIWDGYTASDTPERASTASAITDEQIDAYMGVQQRLVRRFDRNQAQLSARERCREGLEAAFALAAPTTQSKPPTKWIEDPHDIEQGQMLNPEWLAFYGKTAQQVHAEQQTPQTFAPTTQPTGQDEGKMPDRRGVYAWVTPDGHASLTLVSTRPADHCPPGKLNAVVIESSKFYDGCAVDSWGKDGRWVLLHDFTPAASRAAVEPSQLAATQSATQYLTAFFNANGRPPTAREAYRDAFEVASRTPAPAAPCQWQPIATAPTANCPVLAFNRNGRISLETGCYLHNMMNAARIDEEECFYTQWACVPDLPAASTKASGGTTP